MPALLLNGSPHRAGHSVRLAGAVLRAAGLEAEVTHLYDLFILPCNACGVCSASFHCPIDDDVPALRLKLDAASVVLVASPLHFTSLTAPVVALYGRLQPYWRARERGEAPPPAPARRAGGLVLTAGSEYARMFEPARAVTAAVFNTLAIPFFGMATAGRTDRTPPEDNPDAMAMAAELGRALAGATA